MSDEGAYDAEIVCAFVEAHLVDELVPMFLYRPDHPRKAPAKLLNGVVLTAHHREMLARWAKRDTVSLSKVDALLHRYGLMVWELEHWAERERGSTGYLVG